MADVGCKFVDLTSTLSYVRFDFGVGTPRIIDEFTWKQKGNNTYGTWIMEGSVSDGTTWVQLGGAILGGNPNQPYRFTNTVAYRFYRLRRDPDVSPQFTTCAYCYTWENEFGEEGPPSLPVIGSGDANGVWYIGNILDPPALGAEYPAYAKKHLYRTLSGGEGNFYRVSSHVIGAAVPDGWLDHADDLCRRPSEAA